MKTSLVQYVRDLVSLTKPRLSSLVILTTACGIAVAPGKESWAGLLWGLFGTALLVGAANAFNCYLERDTDAWMDRTAKRPLVTGRLSGRDALAFSFALLAISLGLLIRFTNPLTSVLGLVAFASYVGVYTPLKRLSMMALFVGAIPGALPPMMGWTMVTGQVDLGAWILFAILFLWQLPHFIAISLFRKEEYEKAGLKTLPGTLGAERAKWQMLLYTSLLWLVSLLPYARGLAGVSYFVTTIVAGLLFVCMCLAGLFNVRELNWGRIVFLTSLVYLPTVLGIWVADLAVGG